VFLFDEPLSNLDAKLRVSMRAEIKGLHQRLGTTTVYVTHDQVEAMTMADKIVVMRDGVVEQVGAPLTLYDNPVNMFVAGFIGSPAMNFLTGEIREGGFFVGDIRLPLPGSVSEQAGRRAVYGIRPEHIAIAADGVPAEVRVVEPTGAETYLVVRLAGQEITCVVRDRLDVRAGHEIRLAPDPGRVHLFDPQSERRL
jgi:multiple sugar transport system ATP-binding protein